jgi:hypothetical protein
MAYDPSLKVVHAFLDHPETLKALSGPLAALITGVLKDHTCPSSRGSERNGDVSTMHGPKTLFSAVRHVWSKTFWLQSEILGSGSTVKFHFH